MKNEFNRPAPAFPSAAIPSSGDVTGIELRMLPPYIRDNHSLRLYPFFPGRARLYCLTLVVSDVANQLTGLMDLNAFARIGRQECLPINKTIFYWEADAPGLKAPNQVHAMCSIIKSKGSLREAGQVLELAKNDLEYQDLVGELATLTADAASFTAVSNLTLQIAGVVGRYLGRVDDRPLGTVVQSFTRLHGDWDRLGITPVNTSAQDVDFSFELIVRDRARDLHPHSDWPELFYAAREISPAMHPL